jgi:hypothetical protein
MMHQEIILSPRHYRHLNIISYLLHRGVPMRRSEGGEEELLKEGIDKANETLPPN